MPPSDRQKILFFFLVAVGIGIAVLLRETLLVLFTSILFAIMLDPFVVMLERIRIGKWHVKRSLAVLILVVLFTGLLVLIGSFMLPPLVRDFGELAKNWKQISNDVIDWVHLSIPFSGAVTIDYVKNWGKSFMGSGTDLILNFGKSLTMALIVIIASAYFIIDGPRTLDWFFSLFPDHQEARARRTFTKAGKKMQGWLEGQAILMVFHGVSAFIVFGLLGVKNYVALGFFAGIINIIPVIGPILTAIVAGSVAALDSIQQVIGVLIFFTLYHNIENAVLNPWVMHSRVKIPTLTIIVALIIGEAVAGILGILISVPTAVLIANLMDEYVSRGEGIIQPASVAAPAEE